MLLALAVAFGLGRRAAAPASRRAAVLGIAAGLAWGFEAAVIKEFSSRLGGGAAAVFGNWSVYVLITAGAASLLLASHALAAGPLAASQPGFTIVDPLAASLLGLFLFGERMRSGMIDLAGEAAGLALLVVGVSVLSHSQLIHGGDEAPPQAARPSPRGAALPLPPGCYAVCQHARAACAATARATWPWWPASVSCRLRPGSTSTPG